MRLCTLLSGCLATFVLPTCRAIARKLSNLDVRSSKLLYSSTWPKILYASKSVNEYVRINYASREAIGDSQVQVRSGENEILVFASMGWGSQGMKMGFKDLL